MFPLGAGAIDQAETGQIAFLGQPLPEGDFTVEAKINAPGLDEDDSRTDDPYAQVGLGLFQTNDDWIGVYQTRNGDDGSTNNGTYFEVKYENEGGRTLGTRIGQAARLAQNLPTYYLRVTRTGDTLNAEFSRDGTQWTDLLEQDINLAAAVRGRGRARLHRPARHERRDLGDLRVHPVHAGRVPGPVQPALGPVRGRRARPEVGAREPARHEPAGGGGRPPDAAARPRRPVRRQRHARR